MSSAARGHPGKYLAISRVFFITEATHVFSFRKIIFNANQATDKFGICASKKICTI